MEEEGYDLFLRGGRTWSTSLNAVLSASVSGWLPRDLAAAPDVVVVIVVVGVVAVGGLSSLMRSRW